MGLCKSSSCLSLRSFIGFGATHLHGVSRGQATLLANWRKRRESVGCEPPRESGPCLVRRVVRRGSAQHAAHAASVAVGGVPRRRERVVGVARKRNAVCRRLRATVGGESHVGCAAECVLCMRLACMHRVEILKGLARVSAVEGDGTTYACGDVVPLPSRRPTACQLRREKCGQAARTTGDNNKDSDGGSSGQIEVKRRGRSVKVLPTTGRGRGTTSPTRLGFDNWSCCSA